MLKNQFDYYGEILNRVDHLYNSTHISERGVELAVANHFLARTRGKLLELGNVLNHYKDIMKAPQRRVVDLYEEGSGVENIDVFDVSGPFDRIIAISTIEHIGLSNYESETVNPDLAGLAIQHLLELLKPGGEMLVTMPFGWHPTLNFETLGAERAIYLIRTSPPLWWLSEWKSFESISRVRKKNLAYGQITPWASCVWVGEFVKE